MSRCESASAMRATGRRCRCAPPGLRSAPVSREAPVSQTRPGSHSSGRRSWRRRPGARRLSSRPTCRRTAPQDVDIQAGPGRLGRAPGGGGRERGADLPARHRAELQVCHRLPRDAGPRRPVRLPQPGARRGRGGGRPRVRGQALPGTGRRPRLEAVLGLDGRARASPPQRVEGSGGRGTGRWAKVPRRRGTRSPVATPSLCPRSSGVACRLTSSAPPRSPGRPGA